MQHRKNQAAGILLVLVSVLGLNACQQKDAATADSETAHNASLSSDMKTEATQKTSQNPHIIKTMYQCDQAKVIEALYDNSNVNSPKVTLIIDGRQFPMYNVIAPSGTLYATEQGINAGQGMRWHVHGLEGILQAMVLDHTADPASAALLMRCQEPI